MQTLLLLHALACASAQSTEKRTICKIIIFLKWMLCRTCRCRFNKAEKTRIKKTEQHRLQAYHDLEFLKSGPLSCISFSVFSLSSKSVNLYVVFTLIIAIASSHKPPSSPANTIKTTTTTPLMEQNQWTRATTASYWNNLHKIWLLYILIAKFIVCDRRREIAILNTCTDCTLKTEQNGLNWNGIECTLLRAHQTISKYHM